MKTGHKKAITEQYSILELASTPTKNRPRAHVNSIVRPHHVFTPEQRMAAAEKAGWNVFQFPSEMLCGGDLLSDSGTTAMTAEQLSAMILGDEAYGSNWGYFRLLERMESTFGINVQEWEIYLFHQCRAAEHALFTHLAAGREGLAIPSNSFFDTTRANAEANRIEAIDLVAQHPDHDTTHPFKGDMDIARLTRLLDERRGDVPLAYLTITNNTGGGQPVSMGNIRAVRAVCDQYNIPFFLDACRFAENAWFIKQREDGYADKSVADIVREEFSHCDGFTISFKKDGLANMGGALAIRRNGKFADRYPEMFDTLRDHQILVEGHPTYGGLSGRDIMTIESGLETVITEPYLEGRIGQVAAFGARLRALGIPVIEPFGGHAVYIDTDRFFEGTTMTRGDFGGIALTGLLLVKGVRLCELGAFAFGKYDPASGQETFPPHNYVRAAIPRNKYEMQDLDYVAECIKALHDRKDTIPKAIPTWGREKPLRHFKARFEFA